MSPFPHHMVWQSVIGSSGHLFIEYENTFFMTQYLFKALLQPLSENYELLTSCVCCSYITGETFNCGSKNFSWQFIFMSEEYWDITAEIIFFFFQIYLVQDVRMGRKTRWVFGVFCTGLVWHERCFGSGFEKNYNYNYFNYTKFC